MADDTDTGTWIPTFITPTPTTWGDVTRSTTPAWRSTYWASTPTASEYWYSVVRGMNYEMVKWDKMEDPVDPNMQLPDGF